MVRLPLAVRLAALLLLTALRPAAAQPAAMSAAARAALADVRAPAAVASESRSGRSGLTAVWLRPSVEGVEVMDDAALVVVNDAGAVVFRRGEVVGGTVESRSDALGASAAVARAAAVVGVPVAAARGAAGAEPTARRVFLRTDTGALRLAYDVSVTPADPARWAVVRVDAATGAVVSERRLVISETGAGGPPATASPLVPIAEATARLPDGAAYRVVAPPGRSPEDGARGLAPSPADALASPFGWHDTDGLPGPEFTTTRGNNAHAFPDRNYDGQPDAAGVPEGGAALSFDAPLDLASGPEAYTAASVTSAFYWVNYAHDVFYHYGFDEAGGNFQTTGYGRPGGAPGADPVRIRVQDGGATNNASIAIPPDGAPAVMSLFESTRTTPRRDYALDNEVVVHEMAHGLTARLTGGPAENACLSTGGEDMAEGWSDWYALVLTMRAGDARTDARRYSAYTGGPDVRVAPYSTDVALNALTYGSTAAMTARHAIGTVWATVLWELTWDLIDATGFSPDLADARGAAGNQVALSLVTEALRLQPCRPGFVDGRNAILLADRLLYAGAHYGLLQRAFARRGLGRGAAQGLVSATDDNVESFVVETATLDLTPPATLTDLAARTDTLGTTIDLTFTAPGDDGTVGQAARYEVRYGTSPLTPRSFDGARLASDVASPAPAGSSERIVLTGLTRNVTYNVGVRTFDAAGNASLIAVTSVRTSSGPPPPPPVVQQAAVDLDTVAVSVEAGQSARVLVPVLNTGPNASAVLAGILGQFGPGFDFVTLDGPTGAAIPYPRLSRLGSPRLALTAVSADRSVLDAGYADVTLPFVFPFDGQDVTQMRVSTDGYVAFAPGAPSATVPTALGLSGLPNAVIAPYWTDLRISPEGGLYAGPLADGRFAVEFDQMTVASRPTAGTVSFAVTLDRSGEVGLLYAHALPGNTHALRGLENTAGSSAVSVSGAPRDSTVMLLVRPAAILSLDVSSRLIAPGATDSFSVLADARALRPGRYHGKFYATSTGFYSYTEATPLVLDVTRPPASPPPTDPPPTDPPPVEPPAEPPSATPPLPEAVTLGAARPNPMRRTMAVSVGLPAALAVRLAVYDARGREVAVLIEGLMDAGMHDAAWVPGTLAPGLYVVRLVAGREVRTATVVVVR